MKLLIIIVAIALLFQTVPNSSNVLTRKHVERNLKTFRGLDELKEKLKSRFITDELNNLKSHLEQFDHSKSYDAFSRRPNDGNDDPTVKMHLFCSYM